MKRFLIVIAILLCVAGSAKAQDVPWPTQHSTALEGSHVFAGLAIRSLTVVWHTQAARWLMVFDLAALPSNGALTGANTPVFCAPISTAAGLTDGSVSYDWTMHPILNTTGVVAAVSTSATGCFSITVDSSNDAFFAQVR